MAIMMHIRQLTHSMLLGNPMSQIGRENASRYIHNCVSRDNAWSKILVGICAMMHSVAKHESHKKTTSSGVKIKFASGLMMDRGIPQQISSGSDMSVITNCNSKNDA